MGSALEEKLEKYSKDEESFRKLKELVEEVAGERDNYRNYLNLLEAATRHDYDSIMITEMELEEPGPEIVYVNDGFTEMTGYSREEVVGKTPRILQGPKTEREVLDRLKKSLKDGKSFFGHTVNYRKDGSEFVNQWDIHPLTDSEGNITHWVSYQHDITERKRAEKVFMNTDLDFDDLRADSHRTLVDVDIDGNIVMANKAFRDLTGYEKGELANVKAWDLFPRKFRDSLKERFDAGANGSRFGGRDFRGIIRHKSGFPIQVRGNTELLELKDQTLIRAEIENISLQKRVMETLRKRNEDFSKVFNKASEYRYTMLFNDGEPKLDYVSEEFPELTGMTADSVNEGGGLELIVHEDDLDTLNKHYARVREGEDSTCEYRLKTAEGDYLRVLEYGKPVWGDAEETVRGVKGAVSLKADSEDFPESDHHA